jgi:hypothetical protein
MFNPDPSAPNELWCGMGLGVVKCNPPTTNVSVTWSSVSAGIEQMVTTWIVSPPGGDPIFGMWDQGVFRITDPTTFPSQHGTNAVFAAAWGVDYASSDPACIVALCQDHGNDTSGYSLDGGTTWAQFASLPSANGTPKGGCIAAASNTNFVLAGSDAGLSPNKLLYTTNRGATWTEAIYTSSPAPASSGATGWGQNYFWNRQFIIADRVNIGTFYAFNDDGSYGATGTPRGIWKSTDGGAHWSQYYSGNLLSQGYGFCQMRSVPGRAGNFVFTAGLYAPPHPGSQPLYKCTDNGTSLSVTAVPNVFEVRSVGFGAAKPGGGGHPACFILGWVGTTYGVWRSDDFEQATPTWTPLGDGYPLGSFDTARIIEGDSNTYNRCYIGFAGSGFARWN